MGITQQELADYLGITRVRINEVLLGKRAITQIRPSGWRVFLIPPCEYWLGMQTDIVTLGSEEITMKKNIGK